MITMLYEKTLSRKIIGSHEKSVIDESNGKTHNGHANGFLSGTLTQNASIKDYPKAFWSGLCGCLGSRPASGRGGTTDPKEPASMGKILNLMK